MSDLNMTLKGLITQMDAIGSGELTAAKRAEFDGLLAQAQSVKSQIEANEKLATIKQFMNEPQAGAVRSSFAGEALPNEGVINGVTADGYSGEMYATDKTGEQKMAAMKSAAYKDAFTNYLRMAAKGVAPSGNAMKVLSEGIDTAGGFYVPPEFRTELVKKMATMTSVRPNAQVFTVGSDLVHFPKVTYTTDDLYTSGVRFAWTAEAPAANIAESTNPIAGRVTIPVHTATAAIYVTRALMEDAQFDILGYISGLLSESFSLGLEDAYTNGDAIGKPQGFTQHPNATVLNSAGGMMVLSGAAGAVAWGISATAAGATTGVTGAEAALPPQYEAGAKWFANKKTYAALRNLTDAQTRPLWYAGDSFPSVNNGFNPTLLGYPVVKNQFMPDIAAANEPLALGDMKGYYIVDRVGLSVEVYREIAALRDMVVIYARQRTGGQLVHDWRMKLMKTNNA